MRPVRAADGSDGKPSSTSAATKNVTASMTMTHVGPIAALSAPPSAMPPANMTLQVAECSALASSISDLSTRRGSAAVPDVTNSAPTLTRTSKMSCSTTRSVTIAAAAIARASTP